MSIPFVWTTFKHLDWCTFVRVCGKLPSGDGVELALPKRIPRWLRRDHLLPAARVVRR